MSMSETQGGWSMVPPLPIDLLPSRDARMRRATRLTSTAPRVVQSHATERPEVDDNEGDLVQLVGPEFLTSSLEPAVGQMATSLAHPQVHLAQVADPTITIDGSVASVTIARWEGVVLDLRQGEGVMSVLLRSKSGSEPDHTCDISLKVVSEDDGDLVEPGAVFYLEQTRHQRRRTISLAQTLSFRRLPAWSKSMLDSVAAAGVEIQKRFKAPTFVK